MKIQKTIKACDFCSVEIGISGGAKCDVCGRDICWGCHMHPTPENICGKMNISLCPKCLKMKLGSDKEQAYLIEWSELRRKIVDDYIFLFVFLRKNTSN